MTTIGAAWIKNNEKAPNFYVDIFVPDKTKTEKPKEE